VIRAGVIDRGRTVADDDLIAWRWPPPGSSASTARSTSSAAAPWRPTIFEINARFAGEDPSGHCGGADFPAGSSQLARGEAVAAHRAVHADLWMTNYDTGIFLPRAAVDVLRPVPSAD
jgi:hypothetical protein